MRRPMDTCLRNAAVGFQEEQGPDFKDARAEKAIAAAALYKGGGGGAGIVDKL